MTLSIQPSPRLRIEVLATFWLALPIVGGQLLSVAMNVADTLLAGHLSTRVLAAVAMGYQIWVLALLAVLGLMLALTPTVAQLDGAGRRAEAGAMFRQALWLALVLGALLFAGIRLSRPLLVAFGVDAGIVPEAVAFLDAMAWGTFPLALFFACRYFSEGLSLTRPAMYFGIVGLVALVPLAWALMYGRLGLPALGARGAGIAHAAVLWLQAVAFLIYIARRCHYRTAQPFARFDWPDVPALAALLRIGIPMGVAILMEGGLFVSTALLAGSLGTLSAGAHQIAINIASIAFMVPLGIGMATTVRIGNAVGRGDPEGIAWAARAGIAITLATQTVSAALLVAIPALIVAAYTHDAGVATLAIGLLWLAAIFQFADGLQAFFNGALRGLKDTLVPMLITIFAYWGVGFGLGWWLGIARGGGVRGLWIGLIAGLSVAAIGLGWRFATQLRKRLCGSPDVAATD
ncbi:MAG: MATE family efflux transporter [Lysobacterales bacterium]